MRMKDPKSAVCHLNKSSRRNVLKYHRRPLETSHACLGCWGTQVKNTSQKPSFWKSRSPESPRGGFIKPCLFTTLAAAQRSADLLIPAGEAFFGLLLFAEAAPQGSKMIQIDTEYPGWTRVFATIDDRETIRITVINKVGPGSILISRGDIIWSHNMITEAK